MQVQTQDWPEVADKLLELVKQAGITITDGLREAVRQLSELGPAAWELLIWRERVFAASWLGVWVAGLLVFLYSYRRYRVRVSKGETWLTLEHHESGLVFGAILLLVGLVCIPALLSRILVPEAYVLEGLLQLIGK